MIHPAVLHYLDQNVPRQGGAEPIPTGHEPRVQYIPGIRCVALDVYGTLLVSGAGELGSGSGDRSLGEISRRNGFQSVAEYLALPPTRWREVEEHYTQQIADVHAAGRARGIEQPEVDIRQVWSGVAESIGAAPLVPIELLALTYELSANPAALMPGCRELFDGIRSLGLKTAIVSNAQFFSQAILEHLLGASLKSLGCSHCIWSFEHGVAKPDPGLFAILNRSLSKSGIAPHETLYVGNDMLNDVATAGNAGLRTALFAGDRRSLRLRGSDVRVRGQKPNVIITHLEQVMDVIWQQKGNTV